MSNNPRALFLRKELIHHWLNLPMDEAIEAGIKSLAMVHAAMRSSREGRRVTIADVLATA